MWAVLLGVLLALVAATSSRAGVRDFPAVTPHGAIALRQVAAGGMPAAARLGA